MDKYITRETANTVIFIAIGSVVTGLALGAMSMHHVIGWLDCMLPGLWITAQSLFYVWRLKSKEINDG